MDRFVPYYRHLFRALAYHCPDVETFFNFALSCKLASVCCREFSAMKQYTFCKRLEYRYYSISVLPNLKPHGLFYRHDLDIVQTYFNGVETQKIITSHNANYRVCTKIGRRAVIIRNKRIEFNDDSSQIVMTDLISLRVITGLACPYCRMVHHFVLYSWIYYRTCHGPFKFGHPYRIRRAVYEYAMRIK
jgi:hypothetical protein